MNNSGKSTFLLGVVELTSLSWVKQEICKGIGVNTILSAAKTGACDDCWGATGVTCSSWKITVLQSHAGGDSGP